MKPDGSGFERRHLDRKTPWRLVKTYCNAAGIDLDRLGGRGIGIHSMRMTAINTVYRIAAGLIFPVAESDLDRCSEPPRAAGRCTN